MSVPPWILIGAYWLHMLATVVWIGGLFFQTVILTPTLASALPLEISPSLFEALKKRFEPLAWISLTLLIGTGLVQMTANPSYEGLLTIKNRWSIAILMKHITFGGMILIAIYQTWFLHPTLARTILASNLAKETQSDKVYALLGQRNRLVRYNLLLSFIVLGLTAVARTG